MTNLRGFCIELSKTLENQRPSGIHGKCFWRCRAPALENSLQAPPSSHATPVGQDCAPLTRPQCPLKGLQHQLQPLLPQPAVTSPAVQPGSSSLRTKSGTDSIQTAARPAGPVPPRQGVVALHPSPSRAATYPIFNNNSRKTRENLHSPFLLRTSWAAVKSLTLCVFCVSSFHNFFRAGSGQPATTSSLQAASAALSYSQVITGPLIQPLRAAAADLPSRGSAATPCNVGDVPLPPTLTVAC